MKGTIQYLENFKKLINEIDFKALEEIIRNLLEARHRNEIVFFIGNGGSAATASHFAEDLAFCERSSSGESFRALSLNDSSPYMTAIANDFGYEDVFVKQLENLYRDSDVLIVISASGNSINLIKAVQYVNSRGGITIGILGFDGGTLKNLCRHSLIVKTKKEQYGLVESMHGLLMHIIVNYFKTLT